MLINDIISSQLLYLFLCTLHLVPKKNKFARHKWDVQKQGHFDLISVGMIMVGTKEHGKSFWRLTKTNWTKKNGDKQTKYMYEQALAKQS